MGMNKRLSIVISVLESYMVVKRQIKYFKSLNLPDTIEIIFVDDGSDPPIKEVLKKTLPNHGLRNFYIYPSCDYRPWSQACGRNLGAKLADGEFLLMTDIDHILPKKAIMAAHDFDGDKMRFDRSYAVLDKNGNITQNIKTLFRYGFRGRSLNTRRHTNSFVMRRSIYFEIGGYPEKYCDRPKGGNKGDRSFYNQYKRHWLAGNCKEMVRGPIIHVYPGLPEDPLGIFHKLKRYPKGSPVR